MKSELSLNSFSPKPLEHFFYNKKSVGLDGAEINVYKIRTMKHDADQNVPLTILAGEDKEAEDPRIMPSRRWLRQTGLDEFPQVINILRGDMSLFGPRPTSLERFQKYSPRQKRMRKAVKPGIFGNYAFRNKGKKERTWLELDDIYLHLRLRKESEGKSLVLFHGWVFANAMIALLKGANR